MKTKNFLIYSIIYIVLVGLIIAAFFGDTLTTTTKINLNLLAYSYDLELRNVIWISIPIITYVVFSILYFYYYFLSLHFAKKKLMKDNLKFENFLEELVLDKKEKYSFKTKEFQHISELVKKLYQNKTDSISNRLNSAIQLKNMLDNNEICDLKHYKINKNNTLYIQNEINKAKSDLHYAYNIIKNKTEINDDIALNSYNNILNNDNYSNIKMLKIQKTKDDILLLLNRYYNDNLKLSNAELEILICDVDFTEEEYLNIAKKLFAKIEPNSLKALFNKLKNKNENAMKAYLYILAKLVEYDEIMEILYSTENKFEDFEILLFLREQGKSYNVDKIIC